MWWLLLFVPVCHGAPVPDTFTLSVPDGPLSVWMGSSIVLPCSLSPAFTESLQVRWHRPNKYKTPVLLYEKAKIQQQSADPQYRGRVSLIGELEKGDVSLKLENVSRADSGEFVCFVAGDKWYEQASVHLSVKAPPVIGSPPVLSVTDGGSGQVKVTCVSDGWSPQPTLTWRNKGGTEIPSQNNHSAPDAHGLVSVTSWLVHSSSDSQWVACSVGLSEEERKESRILPYISGIDTVKLRDKEIESLKQKSEAQVKELEERLITTGAEVERLKQESTGPWKGLFFSFLVLLLLVSCITGFVLYRRGVIKCKDSKEAASESQQDKLQASKEETESLLKKQSEEVKTLNQTITELQTQLNESKRKEEEKNQQIAGLLKKQSEEVETLKSITESQQDKLQASKGETETEEDTRKTLEEKVKGAENIQKENQNLKQQNEGLEKNQSDEVKTLNLKITELQSQLNESNKEVKAKNQQIAESQLGNSEQKVETPNQQIEDLAAAFGRATLSEKDNGQQNPAKQNQMHDGDNEGATQEQEVHDSAFPQNPALVLTWDRLKAIQESPTLDETNKTGNLRIITGGKRVHCPTPNSTTVEAHYVLCKDTLSSQHYWEVRVADKESWFVGVCRNTLIRQSKGPLTPQNDCWLLCYDKDQGLYVNTDPITQGQVTTPLRIIGVFLDCSGHVLTFYNAESQSYLCAFHDVRSADALVSVISPGVRDNKHIIIS